MVLELEQRIKDPSMRLLLIDLATSVLDNVQDNPRKAALTLEGARIAAAAGRSDLQAHFMAKTADLAMLQVAVWHHSRSMLQLAPRWFQFATEADKKEHDALTSLINELEEKINSLLTDAIAISTQNDNKKVRASVHMSRGGVDAAKYMRYKMDCMRGFRAKLWSRFEFVRYPVPEYLLTISNGDAEKLRRYVKSFTHQFLRAAHFAEEDDDLLAAHAYHNLAVYLKSAYRFRAARKYLAKSRAIARRHNNTPLLQQLDALEAYIRAKNRDTPDYLRGESRPRHRT